MPEFEERPDLLAIRTKHLRLAFRWVGDRWTHAIELGPAYAPYRFAEAVEGDPDRDGPDRVVSPVYQEIRTHRHGQDWMFLLIGRSGPHVFSAVFTVREVPIGDSPPTDSTWIAVDLADQCRSGLKELAATYSIAASPDDMEEDFHGDDLAWLLRGSDPARDKAVRFVLLGASHVTPEEAPESIDLAESGPGKMLAQIRARVRSQTSPYRLYYLWRYVESPRNPRAT